MNSIAIDASRCAKDGLCAFDCPTQVILFQEGQVPTASPKFEKGCIGCGHCVAVCPHEAVTLNGVAPESLPKLERRALPSGDAVELLIRGRRSTRQYKTNEIPRDELTSLLAAAGAAPTARNVRALRWIMVPNRAAVVKLGDLMADFFDAIPEGDPSFAAYGASKLVRAWRSGHDIFFRGAPHLVAIVGEKGPPYSMADGVTALTCLDLLVNARGLGACWAGFFTSVAAKAEGLRAALGVGPDEAVAGGLMLGYPKVRYRRVPDRAPYAINWVG